MSVVEVGTFNVRAGYIGDATCTRCVPALRAAAAPEEVDLISLLYAAGKSLDTAPLPSSSAFANEEAGGPADSLLSQGSGAPPNALLPLWSLRQVERHPKQHIDSLRRLKRDVLENAEQDPLCLVLPEIWHERIDVMEALFQLILEAPGLTTALYCMRPSVGWTFASGAASSIVLDVGHSHTTVTAVLDGYALRHSVDTIPVGGDAVTAQYSELLSKHRPVVEAAAPVLSHSTVREIYWRDWVADVKHCLARVLPYQGGTGSVASAAGKGSALTAVKEAAVRAAADLQAPDGARVHLDERKAALPFEVFFSAAGDEKRNVATLMAMCKRQMDPEWQLHTVPHLLAGAGSLVPGFRDRVVEELKAQDSSYFRYERDGVLNMAQTADGAWVGASMAASSSSFEPLWVTRGEWAEEGASVLYRKLFY
ncbi:putative actin-like protein [Leishmania major strain Friedlin]|uniref:Actin-like protein 4 n=1 Tax=Leishmania major TaxID=5664 RepID=Q4Q2G7_LEIMA|nr:putative actin-like protein [Leishmania major strain Friedlin]ABF58705.1 actin-like protein 4 [Leishmania major]CAG9582255.1 actin-like_protein_-_putative [Leishmania major strain Friedlin]CAJ08098.1 putative actin-like protein [Leishmania major strain Friedlin]|eukprot:XP_001686481.1 putative actin-like protein [Leishmania major strain Friedlin]